MESPRVDEDGCPQDIEVLKKFWRAHVLEDEHPLVSSLKTLEKHCTYQLRECERADEPNEERIEALMRDINESMRQRFYLSSNVPQRGVPDEVLIDAGRGLVRVLATIAADGRTKNDEAKAAINWARAEEQYYAGYPNYTCSDCGGQDTELLEYDTQEGKEYDMRCKDCQSTDIAESPLEALCNRISNEEYEARIWDVRFNELLTKIGSEFLDVPDVERIEADLAVHWALRDPVNKMSYLIGWTSRARHLPDDGMEWRCTERHSAEDGKRSYWMEISRGAETMGTFLDKEVAEMLVGVLNKNVSTEKRS